MLHVFLADPLGAISCTVLGVSNSACAPYFINTAH